MEIGPASLSFALWAHPSLCVQRCLDEHYSRWRFDAPTQMVYGQDIRIRLPI